MKDMKLAHKINFEAWSRTLIGFIRHKGLEHELKDWSGGWPCPIGSDGRLYDAGALMADGGDTRMTAAEEVLAYLLIEIVGAPDDVAYSPDRAQLIIETQLKQAAIAKAPPECPTCDGTGKEGRHSICRDCEETP